MGIWGVWVWGGNLGTVLGYAEFMRYTRPLARNDLLFWRFFRFFVYFRMYFVRLHAFLCAFMYVWMYKHTHTKCVCVCVCVLYVYLLVYTLSYSECYHNGRLFYLCIHVSLYIISSIFVWYISLFLYRFIYLFYITYIFVYIIHLFPYLYMYSFVI